jgi:hypothetical protein
MSNPFQIYYVPYATQRPEYATQYIQISFQTYSSLPAWHTPQQQLQMARNIYILPDTFLTQGNAPANMSITGLTMMTGITGVDDGFAYIPTPFTFKFFGTDYTNASNAPGIYWNTNNVLGFGTGIGTISWLANTGLGIILGNSDRRTNSMYYSGAQTTGQTSYINTVLLEQNNYNDGILSSIAIQLRFARSPNYQYVEVRMSTVGATNGAWNITNGVAFQNTFGAFTWTKGSSIVLRSDLDGSNWTFYNNYYLNF